MQDYFSLFQLPERFALDRSTLEGAYRNVQAQVHPDRFASRSEAERRVAMQWATLANEAYRTLKSPIERARYLLKRRNVEIDAERNTAMSPAFLMQQIAWRESVEEAQGQPEALKRLAQNLQRDEDVMLEDLGRALDEKSDTAGAAELVRRMMFMDRLRSEIDDSIAQLES